MKILALALVLSAPPFCYAWLTPHSSSSLSSTSAKQLPKMMVSSTQLFAVVANSYDDSSLTTQVVTAFEDLNEEMVRHDEDALKILRDLSLSFQKLTTVSQASSLVPLQKDPQVTNENAIVVPQTQSILRLLVLGVDNHDTWERIFGCQDNDDDDDFE